MAAESPCTIFFILETGQRRNIEIAPHKTATSPSFPRKFLQLQQLLSTIGKNAPRNLNTKLIIRRA